VRDFRLYSGRVTACAVSWAVVAVAGLLAAKPASAQQVAPSQIAPQTLRPETQQGAAIALPGAAGLAVPENAAGLSVSLGQVTVEGGFPELQGETAAIVSRLQGRRVTIAQLYAAANALEQSYAAAGYVLARVVVPPQKLADDGPLRLVLVDGFVEAIDMAGVPERQRAAVAARMASIIGRRHVRLADIERRLLLVSDVPGLVLRSTLTSGTTPGGTLLVLEATQNYVTGTLGFDNRLPKSLGTYALNASVSLNSVFGFGEQVYASASSGADLGRAFDGRSPLQVYGGGFVLPIGADGFTLNPEYTNAVTRPDPAAGTPASEGDFQRFVLRAAYPLIRTRAQTLMLQAAYEWNEETLAPDGFPTDLYKDSYHTLRFQAQDAFFIEPWGASAVATGIFSQGLAGRGGGSVTMSGIPLSRDGASPVFSKFDADLRFTKPLSDAVQLALIGRGQTTFGAPVMLAEQFSLDGLDALSAFASGTLEVDEGATLRAELSHDMAIDLRAVRTTIVPYIFVAGGVGVLNRPTAVEQTTIRAGSAGVGLRAGADALGLPYGTSLTLELAERLSDFPGETHGFRADVGMVVRF
jgi:hemolysin activation/secretion protein